MQIYNDNSPESGHRGNIPQHNKGQIWQVEHIKMRWQEYTEELLEKEKKKRSSQPR